MRAPQVVPARALGPGRERCECLTHPPRGGAVCSGQTALPRRDAGLQAGGAELHQVPGQLWLYRGAGLPAPVVLPL
eukprot:scaffold13644_cov117-Isochrysis_galbana.AAC.4